MFYKFLSSILTIRKSIRLIGVTLCVFILVWINLSCCSVTVGVYSFELDDDIDRALREHIHDLNDSVVESLQSNDPATLLGLFADNVLEHENTREEIEQIFPQLVALANDIEFTIYAEYHWKWVGSGRKLCNILPTAEYFGISIGAISDELFISLLDTPGEFNNIMLGLAYAEVDNKWRLISCQIGLFMVADKNAIEWYTEAVDLYDEGCLVPAALRSQMASSCIKPVPFVEYEDEERVEELFKVVQLELEQTYKFPIELSEIDGRPVVYSIEPQFVQNELLHKVNYITSNSLDDIEALEAEANNMIPEMERLFPCLTKGADYIVFNAFTEPPADPSMTYETYGIAIELNQ